MEKLHGFLRWMVVLVSVAAVSVGQSDAQEFWLPTPPSEAWQFTSDPVSTKRPHAELCTPEMTQDPCVEENATTNYWSNRHGAHAGTLGMDLVPSAPASSDKKVLAAQNGTVDRVLKKVCWPIEPEDSTEEATHADVCNEPGCATAENVRPIKAYHFENVEIAGPMNTQACNDSPEEYCYNSWGNHVVLTHELNGITFKSIYAHLRCGSIEIEARDAAGNPTQVSRGQLLGVMGNSGSSSNDHLHFEVRRCTGPSQTFYDCAKDPNDSVLQDIVFRDVGVGNDRLNIRMGDQVTEVVAGLEGLPSNPPFRIWTDYTSGNIRALQFEPLSFNGTGRVASVPGTFSVEALLRVENQSENPVSLNRMKLSAFLNGSAKGSPETVDFDPPIQLQAGEVKDLTLEGVSVQIPSSSVGPFRIAMSFDFTDSFGQQIRNISGGDVGELFIATLDRVFLVDNGEEGFEVNDSSFFTPGDGEGQSNSTALYSENPLAKVSWDLPGLETGRYELWAYVPKNATAKLDALIRYAKVEMPQPDIPAEWCDGQVCTGSPQIKKVPINQEALQGRWVSLGRFLMRDDPIRVRDRSRVEVAVGALGDGEQAGFDALVYRYLGDLLSFDDVDSEDWFEDAVMGLRHQGIVSGRTDGEYAPWDEVTRAEFLKMVMEGATAVGKNYFEEQLSEEPDIRRAFREVLYPRRNLAYPPFEDVPEPTLEDLYGGAWFYRYVALARYLGFVEGRLVNGERLFEPHASITRAEAVKLLSEIFQFPEASPSDCALPFQDTFGHWVEDEGLRNATHRGIIRGYNDPSSLFFRLFRPNEPLNRAEAAVLVWNSMDEGERDDVCIN